MWILYVFLCESIKLLVIIIGLPVSSSLRTESIAVKWSSLPFTALLIPQTLNYFFIISGRLFNSCKPSANQLSTSCLDRASGRSPSLNVSICWLVNAVHSQCTDYLKGLFRHMSRGCSFNVHPPGITAFNTDSLSSLDFTLSTRCALN